MNGANLGRRAALELRLGDAKRDLADAVERRNSHCAQADVQRALAAEAAPSARAGHNAAAIKYRVHAACMDPEIANLRSRVAMLEGMLRETDKPAAPLTAQQAEQFSAVDDTMTAVSA